MTIAMLIILGAWLELYPELRLWRWIWAREALLISREEFITAIENERRTCYIQSTQQCLSTIKSAFLG